MKKVLSLFFVLGLSLLFAGVFAQTTFTKVTSESQLVDGGRYIIVAQSGANYYALGGQKTANRAANQVSMADDEITVAEATTNSTSLVPGEAVVLTLGLAASNEGFFTLYDNVNSGYLYAASSDANQLKTRASANVDAEWEITFSDGVCSVVASASANRNIMRMNENNGTPLFSCYGTNNYSNYNAVSLYVEQSSLSTDPSLSVAFPSNDAFIFNEILNVRLNVRNF
ncbi:MAG: hypothetical protein HUK15_01965, partial [Bacteroidales bacterium]|nr:hypothetical protein [Bacteroidales bacterium]